MRRRGGRSGRQRSSAFTQGVSGPTLFRDTVFSPIKGNGLAATFLLPIKDLVPSLNSRTVVFENVDIEIQPAIEANTTNGPIMANALFNDSFSGGGQATNLLASGPFKLVSQVNPTRFRLDIRKLARHVPQILRPVNSDSEEAIVTFRVNRALTETEDLSCRITTTVRVFPQDEIVNTPE